MAISYLDIISIKKRIPISALRFDIIADTHGKDSDITVGNTFKNSLFIIDVVAAEVVTTLMIEKRKRDVP